MQSRHVLTSLAILMLSSPVIGKTEPTHTIWQTEGYGYIIDVNDSDVTFYDVTKRHCIKNSYHQGKYTGNDIKRLSKTRAEINVDVVHPLQLTWLDKLPEMCQHATAQVFNAVEVFDVYWQTFAEHYAFSDKINWHWQKQYKTFRAKVNEATTPKALVAIIEDLMGHINDGHAFLYDADGSFLAYVNPKDTQLNNRIMAAFKAQSAITSFRAFFSHTVDLTNKTTAKYFDSKHQAQMLEGNFWLARLPDNYSYLHIEDMSGFGSEEENLAADLNAVDRAMKTIMPVLNSSKGLVLDLRWNGGGEDLVAMKILSYFIDKPLSASRKYAKLTEGFTAPKDVVVQPAKSTPYLGPVVVLTSEATASAAESFGLGLFARGNVEFIGAPSNGAYSDMLQKQLPNGWTFSLSNEVYVDLAGNNYELTGFPVTQQFDYFDVEALKQGKDPAMQAAMDILTKAQSGQ